MRWLSDGFVLIGKAAVQRQRQFVLPTGQVERSANNQFSMLNSHFIGKGEMRAGCH